MNEAMTQGVELMFTGMGIVFLFLVMLIGVVKLMAYCVMTFFPDAEIVPASASPKQTASTNGVTPAITAAITAAVHQHRAKR
ncbi:oxaloacetate decarboxylase, gamma subunit [Bathymodiolus platifrons methanotrophic gill symbiont]|uniref:OadG family protein n=1 Tax=Bathymodiolus platifrons methanotrophic gill symbiont TaxID=113268 RepID=UPI000B41D8DF|nr:OadG family transporter subunit [Bathymodiolus platifrons methanotrophic gill symbiont]MCK5869520.1 OadG family protein [Methyloprofundus sp.]TXK96551.1 sodium pump decarboxylase subunit gamma [Methylococcaceae bacterium CS4]TXK98924.1 sodium pump decarboxylase subunit gamma [Methylococcaceae bacterium CS5]TXL06823.1 sodium pump decarboxylase subunit gamma [Methylococcaceae bacterium CS3]TXL07585.1 sodium pump decarboxylase subunit gamma [Methylococcaceae bacterium CS1]TXL11426.1 sodium pu